jgi:hypothetical protein
MIAGGLSIFLIVFGGLCLWAKDKARDKFKMRYFISLGALLSILGAGTLITQVPAIGPMITSLTGWAQGLNGLMGIAVAGAAFALTMTWIAAALPDEMFKYDPPDGLAYAGLAIPSLLSSLPGSFGQGVADFVTAAAKAAVIIGTSWFM